MKKLLFILHCSFFILHCSLLSAANTYIQTTSADWEGLSGLRFKEYKITLTSNGAGLDVYYLDAFPCYGVAEYVHAWVDAKPKKSAIRLACIRAPREISLAYRFAKKDAPKGKAEGVMRCRLGANLDAELSECERTGWADFEKSED